MAISSSSGFASNQPAEALAKNDQRDAEKGNVLD
jgi:hypothetical protein